MERNAENLGCELWVPFFFWGGGGGIWGGGSLKPGETRPKNSREKFAEKLAETYRVLR